MGNWTDDERYKHIPAAYRSSLALHPTPAAAVDESQDLVALLWLATAGRFRRDAASIAAILAKEIGANPADETDVVSRTLGAELQRVGLAGQGALPIPNARDACFLYIYESAKRVREYREQLRTWVLTG